MSKFVGFLSKMAKNPLGRGTLYLLLLALISWVGLILVHMLGGDNLQSGLLDFLAWCFRIGFVALFIMAIIRLIFNR